MKLLRKIIFSINIILVVVTLLAYLSPFINPAKFWALSFLGLVVPILLFLNLTFVFYWLITEWKRSWISIACLLVGAHYINLTFSFNGSEPEPNKSTFSVASFNFKYGTETNKPGTYRSDKDKIAAFSHFVISEIDSDILCGQESSKRVRKWIGKYYPYQHSVENLGTSIFSRYPIVNRGNIEFGTITNSCVWADIKVKADTFRVYSGHLQSNMITLDADKIVEEVEQKQQLDIMNIRTILAKYKKYVARRSSQALKVRLHMDQSPYPVIFCADLNDPPVSYTHRVLAKDMTDSFVAAGNGMGITYAGNVPMLRIDNIILSPRFNVYDHRVIRKRFSDHYPVRVVLSFGL